MIGNQEIRLFKGLSLLCLLGMIVLVDSGCIRGRKQVGEHDRIMQAMDVFELALERETAGDFQGAKAAYEESLSISPRPITWYRIGLIQSEMGNHEDALASLDQALALVPNFVYAERAKVRVKARMEMRELGQSGSASSEELIPQVAPVPESPIESEEIEAAESAETAPETAATAVEQPAEPEQEEEVITEELAQQSEEEIEPEVEIEPTPTPEPIQQETPVQEVTEAKELPAVAREESDGSVDLALARGYQAASEGNWGQAETIYQETLQSHPGEPRLYYNLGNIYQRQKQFKNAYTHYRKAIELNPQYGRAWNNLGYVLEQLNQSEEALQSYEKAISTGDIPEASFNAGLLLEKKGRLDEALNNFREYIKQTPSGDLADTAREHIKRLERQF